MAQVAASQVTVEIIRTSAKGAKLVTDGTKAAWVQGRCVREDNTLTRWGVEALEASEMTAEQARNYDAYVEEQRAARQAAYEQQRAAARAAAREVVEVRIKKTYLVGGTEKALKIWTGSYTMLYRKQVKAYVYLPVSQVEVLSETEEEVTLSMPTWLQRQYGFWAAIAA